MKVQEFSLSALEEYRPEKIVLKPVYESAGSKALLLHLLPGQEVPIHPHPNWEVTLLPRHGQACLVSEDGAETVLSAGALYYGDIAPSFGIQNRTQKPFQMLILLVRVGPVRDGSIAA